MTIDKAVLQLQALRARCADAAQYEDAAPSWRKDVEALDVAVAVLTERIDGESLRACIEHGACPRLEGSAGK